MRRILCLLMLSALFLILASCSKDEISDDPSIEPPKHVHSFGEWTVKTPSSCTEQGTEERICVCGAAETRPIDPVEHSFGEWAVKTPSSCTERGTEERICVCGAAETRPIDPVEHSFGEWAVKTPSSCAERGTEERVCVCGTTETRPIDPVEHSFGDWEIVTPANCVEAGTMQRVCRNCSHTESAPTESVHSLGDAEPFIEATCYQKGYTIYRCTVCTYYEVREIAQTHEFSVEVEVYPATCVQSGGIERYCSKCEKTLFDYTDPLGHDEYGWTRDEDRSNSVVLVEYKGCFRCDTIDEERRVFVKNTFSAGETILEITNPYSPANPAFNYTQGIERVAGSCYSKKGYYQAYLSNDGGLAVLVLLNTNNEIVCSDVRTDLGYANDITYNSKTNQLLVINEKKVVIFDGDTLAYVRTVNMPRTGDSIAYVESTDQYAIMVDNRVEYYNANFGYVCSFRIFNFGNGPYQICADDNYVYVMFVANDGVSRNVHVYLHNGKALGKVAIQKSSSLKPTGISIVDGYLYISVPDDSLRTLLKKLE